VRVVAWWSDGACCRLVGLTRGAGSADLPRRSDLGRGLRAERGVGLECGSGGPSCSLRRIFVRPGPASRRTANHRGEVALRRGLAAALDKYEELPHGPRRLATDPGVSGALCRGFPECETTSRRLDPGKASAKLVS
jgi:hypothetical protein